MNHATGTRGREDGRQDGGLDRRDGGRRRRRSGQGRRRCPADRRWEEALAPRHSLHDLVERRVGGEHEGLDIERHGIGGRCDHGVIGRGRLEVHVGIQEDVDVQARVDGRVRIEAVRAVEGQPRRGEEEGVALTEEALVRLKRPGFPPAHRAAAGARHR
jgi:hypothetical protein